MKLYRIIFPVTDIERAAAFYSYVFEQAGQRVSSGRHYFDLGGTIIACYDPVADGDELNDGWQFHDNQYIYIAVKNLENMHRKLQASECKAVDAAIETMPWGERLFYAKDPFGNPVCFVDEKTVFTGG